MTYSNLSKIRPKLRTQGNITGNFGRPKSKAGSSLNEIGMSTKETIKCATQDEYLSRLYYSLDKTTYEKLKQFIYTEIRNIHVQRGTW
jgi:predicted solute-binding protein